MKALGLFELTLIVISVMCSLFQALLMVTLNLDPLHLWLQNFGLQFDGFLYVLVRYTYFCYLSQYIIAAERTVGVMLSHLVVCRIIHVKSLGVKQIQLVYIRKYSIICLVTNIMQDTERAATALLLGGLFMLDIGSICCGFLGWKWNNPGILGFGLFLLTVSLTFSCCIFFVGCRLFDNSTNLLHLWETNICMDKIWGQRKSLHFKLLKSLSIVAFPAGYVGIIDQDIKMNFYATLVDYTSTMLITLQDFV